MAEHQSRSNRITSSAASRMKCKFEALMFSSKDFLASKGLQFWVDSEASYSLLAPLAQDLLAAPASQAYVERVFSLNGDLAAGKRNRLTKNLEKRTFLKINKKYYDL